MIKKEPFLVSQYFQFQKLDIAHVRAHNASVMMRSMCDEFSEQDQNTLRLVNALANNKSVRNNQKPINSDFHLLNNQYNNNKSLFSSRSSLTTVTDYSFQVGPDNNAMKEISQDQLSDFEVDSIGYSTCPSSQERFKTKTLNNAESPSQCFSKTFTQCHKIGANVKKKKLERKNKEAGDVKSHKDEISERKINKVNPTGEHKSEISKSKRNTIETNSSETYRKQKGKFLSTNETANTISETLNSESEFHSPGNERHQNKIHDDSVSKTVNKYHTPNKTSRNTDSFKMYPITLQFSTNIEKSDEDTNVKIQNDESVSQQDNSNIFVLSNSKGNVTYSIESNSNESPSNIKRNVRNKAVHLSSTDSLKSPRKLKKFRLKTPVSTNSYEIESVKSNTHEGGHESFYLESTEKEVSNNNQKLNEVDCVTPVSKIGLSAILIGSNSRSQSDITSPSQIKSESNEIDLLYKKLSIINATPADDKLSHLSYPQTDHRVPEGILKSGIKMDDGNTEILPIDEPEEPNRSNRPPYNPDAQIVPVYLMLNSNSEGNDLEYTSDTGLKSNLSVLSSKTYSRLSNILKERMFLKRRKKEKGAFSKDSHSSQKSKNSHLKSRILSKLLSKININNINPSLISSSTLSTTQTSTSRSYDYFTNSSSVSSDIVTTMSTESDEPKIKLKKHKEKASKPSRSRTSSSKTLTVDAPKQINLNKGLPKVKIVNPELEEKTKSITTTISVDDQVDNILKVAEDSGETTVNSEAETARNVTKAENTSETTSSSENKTTESTSKTVTGSKTAENTSKTITGSKTAESTSKTATRSKTAESTSKTATRSKTPESTSKTATRSKTPESTSKTATGSKTPESTSKTVTGSKTAESTSETSTSNTGSKDVLNETKPLNDISKMVENPSQPTFNNGDERSQNSPKKVANKFKSFSFSNDDGQIQKSPLKAIKKCAVSSKNIYGGQNTQLKKSPLPNQRKMPTTSVRFKAGTSVKMFPKQSKYRKFTRLASVREQTRQSKLQRLLETTLADQANKKLNFDVQELSKELLYRYHLPVSFFFGVEDE